LVDDFDVDAGCGSSFLKQAMGQFAAPEARQSREKIAAFSAFGRWFRLGASVLLISISRKMESDC